MNQVTSRSVGYRKYLIGQMNESLFHHSAGKSKGTKILEPMTSPDFVPGNDHWARTQPAIGPDWEQVKIRPLAAIDHVKALKTEKAQGLKTKLQGFCNRAPA